ncbi:metalloregulator ArsR/SmtB family transcription factor [Streptomyces sp. NPDC002589]|uniref:ArsR/SmtB family transcription factor n=1 Tax=unclassified Streptomyces TaxID=2593676 RepID=UPI0033271D18
MAAEAGRRVEPSADVLAEAGVLFGLLASSVRLHLLWVLSQGENDVTGLADQVEAAMPAVSQHLSKLKLAGLVGSRREGRRQVYFAADTDASTVVRELIGQLAARAGAEPGPSLRWRAPGA